MVLTLTVEGYTETTATATGPASNTTVTAGASATITLTYTSMGGVKNIVEVVGIVSVSGLPDGIAIEGITAGMDNVTLKVRNTTGGDITITSGSVTVAVRVIGY